MSKKGRILAAAAAIAAAGCATYAVVTWARFGTAKRSSALLDGVMPEYDVRLDHKIRIHAAAASTFEAMRHTDFERSPIVQALFRARQILLGGRHVARTMPQGLLDQLERIGWRIVAQEPGRELVFAAVTQPWLANPVFRPLPAEEFLRFAEPGYVQIAFNLRVDPLDAGSSVARTETRVRATDPESRRRFRKYWMLVSPGIELIRIVLLSQLKAEAESRRKREALPEL